MTLLNIGAGISDFRKLRAENRYYIDKTGFIEEFFNQPMAETTLLTRPRRFGKTLTMSMLKEFFDITGKDKENIFEGLAISKNKELCAKWQHQYPVVFLTLKKCVGEDFEEALSEFSRLIGDTVDLYHYLQQSDKVAVRDKNDLAKLEQTKDIDILTSSLQILCRALCAETGKPVILLIDEYDVPLNHAYQKNYYPAMINFLRKFLETALKDNRYLQFAVLTGCLRITKKSVFTGLNNFVCYGIADDTFSTTFGFTSQEVDMMLRVAGLQDKKSNFKDWYDGYIFGDSSEIYCPWDVLLYLMALQRKNTATPQAYWMNSSGNDIVRLLLERTDEDLHDKIETLINGGCIAAHITEQKTYDILKGTEDNVWSMLYTTGYLTKASDTVIAECGYEKEAGETYLVIPNKEVNLIYEENIRNWLKEDLKNMDTKELITAFWNCDTEAVSNIITDVLERSISYHDCSEKFYHGILLGIFLSAGYRGLSNRESGIGRYDILVKQNSPSRCAIIEVKRTKEEEERGQDAEAALEQINSRKYDFTVTSRKKIYHWGMSFYKKSCLAKVREVKEG